MPSFGEFTTKLVLILRHVTWWGLCAACLAGLIPGVAAQSTPSWEGMAEDRAALAQQTILLGMRLYLESELEVVELDVSWAQSPKAMRRDLEALVDDVMALQGERELPGFDGFSQEVLELLGDVEELDERDLARTSGRMSRPLEERFYLLVQGRLNELEMQLALELGVFQRSGLWEQIAVQGGWSMPKDPGVGGTMEAVSVPISRALRDVLEAEDRSAFPSASVSPAWSETPPPVSASPARGPRSVTDVPALADLNVPERFDVPFASGSSVLDLNARMQLAEVRDLMVRFPQLRAVCTGHADAHGPRRMNEELSRVRAEAVRAKILECGVAEERVLMNYFGEDRAGWEPEWDRRVEVTFYWMEP